MTTEQIMNNQRTKLAKMSNEEILNLVEQRKSTPTIDIELSFAAEITIKEELIKRNLK